MLTTQALNAFLTARARLFPAASDLMLRWTPDMETQVNVAADGHEKIDGTRGAYTDGVRKWWNIRIPKHADSSPEWTDYEMTWPLDLHAEAIGSTGWDWKLSRSRWCGFDFDAIAGHAEGVGISAERLEEVRQAATDIPWVEVRKSTGGKGIHLYVYFDEDDLPITANHTEHAALARAVLSMLSAAAQYDFASQIDACGGNMWLWHRKMTVENGGLSLVKAAERPLKASELASNWRDHAEVVTRKRNKIRLRALEPNQEKDFETLATSRKFVPLDDRHQRLIEKLAELGHEAIWVSDYHCLQTHTLGLKQISDDADLRAELGLVGYFDTISSGSTSVNCFMFPLADGAWKVCRFTLGLHEAPSWNQSPASWTYCYFNQRLNLDDAARAFRGLELDNNRGFQFASAEDAIKAAAVLGETIDLATKFQERKAVLRSNKDGRLVIDVKRLDEDVPPGSKWFEKSGQKAWWSTVCQSRTEVPREELNEFDHFLRVVTTPAGDPAGKYVLTDNGHWDVQTESMVKTYLRGRCFTKSDAEETLGKAVRRRWESVSLPFEGEYPGNRCWNRRAPQLRIQPANVGDELDHPKWDQIINHCGASLTKYLPELEWARKGNILTGGDYLRAWFAAILQEPFSKLPFLVLHGKERCGKSTLWEAFGEILVTKGVVLANNAIASQQNFNGELEGAILCVINEVDLRRTQGVMEKLRGYITDRELSIHKKFCTVYSAPNSTHWMYLSNHWDALPLRDGDTRCTVFEVAELPAGSQIPKEKLWPSLTAEAPAFLRTLLDLPLPEQIDRLRLPVVDTDDKRLVVAVNKPAVDQFLDEKCFRRDGALTEIADLYAAFLGWLPESEKKDWTKPAMLKALPRDLPRGAHTNNVRCIGNLSLVEDLPTESRPWIARDGRLIRDLGQPALTAAA